MPIPTSKGLRMLIRGQAGNVFYSSQKLLDDGNYDWTQWYSLATKSPSNVLALKFQDERVGLVTVGPEGDVVMRTEAQLGASNLDQWSRIQSIGKVFAGVKSEICAAANKDGTIQLFVVGGDGVYTANILAKGTDWTSWKALPTMTDPVQGDPSVGVLPDGRLMVLVVSGNRVFGSHQKDSANPFVFSGWVSYGHPSPAVAAMDDQSLQQEGLINAIQIHQEDLEEMKLLPEPRVFE